MSFLDRYDKDERPVAKKVMLDVAVYRISLVVSKLYNHILDYAFEDFPPEEAVRLSENLLDAESFLKWSIGRDSEFPWDTPNFHAFWTYGGQFEELESMAEYAAQMPKWYRTIAVAAELPDEYGRTLIEAIPAWRAG